MKNIIEKFGTFGAILAAAACPICFPKLAIIGGLLGLGALTRFESFFFFGSQILVGLVCIGNVLTYRKNKNKKIISLVIVSTVVFFLSLYVVVTEILSYLAFFGLIVANIVLVVEQRKNKGGQIFDLEFTNLKIK